MLSRMIGGRVLMYGALAGFLAVGGCGEEPEGPTEILKKQESKTLRESGTAETKEEEQARVEKVVLAQTYSELRKLAIPALQDQLKARKLKGETGFTVTQKDREAYVLQLQALIFEAHGAQANDLDDGDAGTVADRCLSGVCVGAVRCGDALCLPACGCRFGAVWSGPPGTPNRAADKVGGGEN